jgi:hypothetical protein
LARRRRCTGQPLPAPARKDAHTGDSGPSLSRVEALKVPARGGGGARASLLRRRRPRHIAAARGRPASARRWIRPPDAAGHRLSHQQQWGADLATTEWIWPPMAAAAWILPRATAARDTGLGGLFLFREIINRGGHYNTTASVNSVNRGGCLMPTSSVNELTEAVRIITSVKTLINRDFFIRGDRKTHLT